MSSNSFHINTQQNEKCHFQYIERTVKRFSRAVEAMKRYCTKIFLHYLARLKIEFKTMYAVFCT